MGAGHGKGQPLVAIEAGPVPGPQQQARTQTDQGPTESLGKLPAAGARYWSTAHLPPHVDLTLLREQLQQERVHIGTVPGVADRSRPECDIIIVCG
jgi:hypothetical protein